jgi:hypothetical protein
MIWNGYRENERREERKRDENRIGNRSEEKTIDER